MKDKLNKPEAIAELYWKTSCTLSISHVFGVSWPNLGHIQRSRLLGHLGCNPGIALILSHLCAHQYSERNERFNVLLGTGHASSFLFAHYVIENNLEVEEINDLIKLYGNNIGYTSELLNWPYNLNFHTGELGNAISFSRAFCLNSEDLMVCIVGDGELETPNTLAGFCHEPSINNRLTKKWLPVINWNSHKMGSSTFPLTKAIRLLKSFDYEVLVSSTDFVQASTVCLKAISIAKSGRKVVWISVTEKGWPLPEKVADICFRGAEAHKIPKSFSSDNTEQVNSLLKWIRRFSKNVFLPNGKVNPRLPDIAKLASFNWEVNRKKNPCIEYEFKKEIERPIIGVDEALVVMNVIVTSPDEARSNRLTKCLENNNVIEVLSEATCFNWSLGLSSSGLNSCFVTYEAFAGIVSTQIAQHIKRLHLQEYINENPASIVMTSLSWENCQTHQNTDIVATLLSRPLSVSTIYFPIGASSAYNRLQRYYNQNDIYFASFFCSKWPLINLPDPGGKVLRIKFNNSKEPQVYIVAIGDVGLNESIFALHGLEKSGISASILSIIDFSVLDYRLKEHIPFMFGKNPILTVSSVNPLFLDSFLNKSFLTEGLHSIGWQDKFGYSPENTLYQNGLDRKSIAKKVIEILKITSKTKEVLEVISLNKNNTYFIKQLNIDNYSSYD